MSVSLQAARGRWNSFGIVLVAGWLAPLATQAADWPQFLGPERNGSSPETGLLTLWAKDGPPRLWQRPVGAGFSGPVVAAGRLVLFHRLGDKEVVACLDAATGEDKWQFTYPSRYRDDFGMDEGPRSTPLIAGGRVYTLGAEGELHCLELATGKKIWTRSLNRDYQVPKGFFGVATSPLLEGSLLLLNVGGKEAGILALDKDTGREVWRATKHGASYSSPVAATFHGQRRVAFFTREGIVLLDPGTGEVQYSKHWRARLQASVNAASPVISGDLLFVSACYGTGAIVLRIGADRIEELWKSGEVMSNHYNTCVASKGFLYGFDGRQEEGARLRCVELKTGKVRWTADPPGCGSVILAQESLLILNEHGQLVLVEATPDAYKEKLRVPVLTAPCRSPIALANGLLYARDSTRLVCWDLRDPSGDQRKATVAYLQACQEADGGFVPARAGRAPQGAARSSLRASSAALRALKYLGGDVRDRAACARFVRRCFDQSSGGFADHPGLPPDVTTTALGIMAVVELKLSVDDYREAAVKYLATHAQSFEEIRIAAAGLEAIAARPRVADAWLEQLAKLRHADGTYGTAEGAARATGGAVVAVLRLGGQVDQRAHVLQALTMGQRSDGGFGKEPGKSSDLETSYRVLRALVMLKSKPASERVRSFVASCRNPDGGYGNAPGQPSSVVATYFAASILHWLQEG